MSVENFTQHAKKSHLLLYWEMEANIWLLVGDKWKLPYLPKYWDTLNSSHTFPLS